MKPIRNFSELTSHLQNLNERKRIVVVCANDEHTEYAIKRAVEEGIADLLLIGDAEKLSPYEWIAKYPERIEIIDEKDPDAAARRAVKAVREKQADILMKGLINTDNLLRAVLDKENGLLPKGNVMTHLSVAQINGHDKLLFFSDAAVIPNPTLAQREAIINYAVTNCRHFGIETPKVSMIHCSEKVNPKFPLTLDYVAIKEKAAEGMFGDIIIDGPLDVKTSCEKKSGNIKGICSPVNGEADILIFPDIESGNVFYKTISLFSHADIAGALQGTICPVILSSRSDSGLSKFYSLAMACLTAGK